MNLIDDGQIIRNEDVMTGFKIPKRKLPQPKSDSDDEESVNYCNTSSFDLLKSGCGDPIQGPSDLNDSSISNPNEFGSFSSYQPQQNVGLNSEYEQCNDYQNSPRYAQNQRFENNPNKTLLSYNQFKRFKETPKTEGQPKLNLPYENDSTLPKELTSLFQPLYCKLCTVQLNSNIMAKLHYKSKNHDKNIRKFLIEHSVKTGEPLHKKAMVTSKPKTDNVDPKSFFCEVCNIPLSGPVHAESHYMGRNHRKALAGQRTNDKGLYITEFQRSGLSTEGTEGMDFVRKEKEQFRCDLCGVCTTSIKQMEMHYAGQKHKKQMKMATEKGLVAVPETECDSEDKNLIAADIPTDNILASVLNSEGTKDLSVYRTPTGYFYCGPCDLSVNSDLQFQQHLGSKKHHKKIAGVKDAN